MIVFSNLIWIHFSMIWKNLVYLIECENQIMNMFLLQIEFDYTIPLTDHLIIYYRNICMLLRKNINREI